MLYSYRLSDPTGKKKIEGQGHPNLSSQQAVTWDKHSSFQHTTALHPIPLHHKYLVDKLISAAPLCKWQVLLFLTGINIARKIVMETSPFVGL